MSNRNEKRITVRTSSYREMEAKLKDTTQKLKKSEKERRFYKGTLELVEKQANNFSTKKPSQPDSEEKKPLLENPPDENMIISDKNCARSAVQAQVQSAEVPAGPPVMPPNIHQPRVQNFYQPYDVNANAILMSQQNIPLRPIFLTNNNPNVYQPAQSSFYNNVDQRYQSFQPQHSFPISSMNNLGRLQAEQAIRTSREHADFYQRMLDLEIQKLQSQGFRF